MKKFLHPSASVDDGETGAPSQTISQQTQAAVPILHDASPPDTRWVDDTTSTKASPDARSAWQPTRDPKAVLTTLGGVKFGGSQGGGDDDGPAIGGGHNNKQTRRGRGATHDLRYDEWVNPLWKRSRSNVLPDPVPPVRPPGSGAPMQGVLVHFPEGLTPHVPQKITMSKILTALTKKQNALIESPTGTGKSLSLLCSALAWQEQERVTTDEANVQIKMRNESSQLQYERECALRRGARNAQHEIKIKSDLPEGKQKPTDDPVGAAAAVALNNELDQTLALKNELEAYGPTVRDALIQASVVNPRTFDVTRDLAVHVIKNENTEAAKPEGVPRIKPEACEVKPEVTAASAKPGRTTNTSEKNLPPIEPPTWEPLQGVPKIYLCSRTHSQLHQLVKELKRTPYRPKYTILGSRKQYCPINKNDEECTELTKNKNTGSGETSCGYVRLYLPNPDTLCTAPF